MITGVHVVIYSKDPEADRAFFKDVFAFPNVDVGHGWLIFALPPAEVAFHPAERNNVHEFFLQCRDIGAVIGGLTARNVVCAPVFEESWGITTKIQLPGGGELGLYQPKHPLPPGPA